MGKVCLALIHNFNEQRNAYIRPHLAALSAAISAHFKIELFEVAHQSNLKPHGLLMAFFAMLFIKYWIMVGCATDIYHLFCHDIELV